jgi:hypothetical protein
MKAETFSQRFSRWANACPDDTILRWLYGSLVAASIGVLALDYAEMSGLIPEDQKLVTSTPKSPQDITAKPASEPLPPSKRSGSRGPAIRPDAALGKPMTFDLAADGRLMATGFIAPGSADALAQEVEKRGSYVKTVVLHSSGGSVLDALKMGRLIREKKLNTTVENGKYCASSCPLIFAGGVERVAGNKATIGVHQIFSASDRPFDADRAMAHTQKISAQVQTYLHDMGVDLGVWTHAMDTPKEQLYYFKHDELSHLKLATQTGPAPQPNAAKKPTS